MKVKQAGAYTMAITFVPGAMHHYLNFTDRRHNKYRHTVCLGFVINESEASTELVIKAPRIGDIFYVWLCFHIHEVAVWDSKQRTIIAVISKCILHFRIIFFHLFIRKDCVVLKIYAWNCFRMIILNIR